MKRTWTSEELLEHFTLLPDELVAVGNKSGATRLEMAVFCLHLIQVILALVNTLMLQEVLAEDTWKAPMKPEDWRGFRS